MAEEEYILIGQKIKDAEQSQMFGKPCFKINGKAFVCFFQNEMVLNLMAKIIKEHLAMKGLNYLILLKKKE